MAVSAVLLQPYKRLTVGLFCVAAGSTRRRRGTRRSSARSGRRPPARGSASHLATVRRMRRPRPGPRPTSPSTPSSREHLSHPTFSANPASPCLFPLCVSASFRWADMTALCHSMGALQGATLVAQVMSCHKENAWVLPAVDAAEPSSECLHLCIGGSRTSAVLGPLHAETIRTCRGSWSSTGSRTCRHFCADGVLTSLSAVQGGP